MNPEYERQFKNSLYIRPAVANQIGQYYKNQKANQGDQLTDAQQQNHLLAHSILGAAVSYANGNNATTGALAAASGEAAAPLLAKYLYHTDDPSQLTAEQKDTITSITGATIGASTGNTAETGKVAVENNTLKQRDINSLLRNIGKAERTDNPNNVSKAVRNTYALASKKAANNWKAIQSCYNHPTSNCLNRIKKDYGNVRYDELKRAVRQSPATYNLIVALEGRNKIIASCTQSPKVCLEQDNLNKVAQAAPSFMLFGVPGLEASEVRESAARTAGGSSKGNSFRGGRKSQRDKWYGHNEKDFQRWWHREGKQDFGGKDIENAAEAKSAYQTWIDLGKPNVK